MPASSFRLLLLLLLVIAGPCCRAQVFEPGYLVVGRGDTLRGEVENAYWQDPPVEVRFRTTPGGPVRAYSAQQVRALYLASGRLMRHELLPLDRSAETAVSRLRRGLYFNQRPDSVLADVLVDGPAPLLRVVLSNVTHYFVRKPGQPYLELAERRYLREQNGGWVATDGNDYANKLRYYFADCPVVSAAADQTAFTAPALAQLVQLYNRQCSREQQPGREIAASPRYRPKTIVNVGLLAGGRYNSLRLRREAFAVGGSLPLEGQEMDGRVHAQGGLYMDVITPGRRVAMHLAVLASRYGGGVEVPLSGPSASAGRYTWGGLMTSGQLGLRALRPLGAEAQVLVGAGVELNVFTPAASSIDYGPGAPPASMPSPGAQASNRFQNGFASSYFPYLEIGARRGAFTAMLQGRVYGQGYYEDPLLASLGGGAYLGRTWSLGLTLGLRLNRNPDTQP